MTSLLEKRKSLTFFYSVSHLNLIFEEMRDEFIAFLIPTLLFLTISGAGLPRTGTLSLKMALTKLYSANCSHFYDVFAGEQVLSVRLFPGSEAEFLDVIGTKVLRVFLLAIHSHLYYTVTRPYAGFHQDGAGVIGQGRGK